MNKIKAYLTRSRLIMIAYPIILLIIVGFAERKADEQKVSDLKIEIDSEGKSPYITVEEINDRLNARFEGGVVGMQVKSLDAELTDSLVSASPFVRTSRTYASLDGKVYMRIEQEKPILRIINNDNESFYINSLGDKMPLSRHYTARVPVATGLIAEQVYPDDTLLTNTLRDLYRIAQYLDNQPYFKALTGQLFVDENGDIVLITKNEERHDIILGDASNLEHKFKNLKEFYTKVLPVKGWDYYRSINLKYKNQLIAKK